MPLASYMIPLRDEVVNDPLVRDYANMTNQQVADDLNTQHREKHRRVPLSEIQDWASAKRLYKRFVDNGIEGGSLHNELRTLIEGKQESVNFQSDATGVSDLINDLVGAGVLTETEAGELQALGTYYVSRAAELGYNSVSASQIATIRSN